MFYTLGALTSITPEFGSPVTSTLTYHGTLHKQHVRVSPPAAAQPDSAAAPVSRAKLGPVNWVRQNRAVPHARTQLQQQ